MFTERTHVIKTLTSPPIFKIEINYEDTFFNFEEDQFEALSLLALEFTQEETTENTKDSLMIDTIQDQTLDFENDEEKMDYIESLGHIDSQPTDRLVKYNNEENNHFPNPNPKDFLSNGQI